MHLENVFENFERSQKAVWNLSLHKKSTKASHFRHISSILN